MTTFETTSEALTTIITQGLKSITKINYKITLGQGKDYEKFLESTTTKLHDCFINMVGITPVDFITADRFERQNIEYNIYIRSNENIEKIIILLNEYINTNNRISIQLNEKVNRIGTIRVNAGNYITDYSKPYYEMGLTIKF